LAEKAKILAKEDPSALADMISGDGFEIYEQKEK
jgi:hypothetical protein